MSAKRLKEEYGYSLVEVMVSIMIMALAILPMMAMFDMGLRSATTGSNYPSKRLGTTSRNQQGPRPPTTARATIYPIGGRT
jgi:prepilin-type N-terminal cleavage/methylation domain-containing protein